MIKILEFSFSPPIIVYTILFAIALVYWMIVFIGALDLDSFDFDIDVDADIDVDLDVDLDVDADADVNSSNSGGNSIMNLLKFFNLGEMPFMILYSFFSMFLWAVAMLTHLYFSDGSWLFGLVVFIPILFVSLIFTKILTTPLAKFFKNFKEDASVDFIGERGKIVLSASTTSWGRMEIYHKSRSFILKVLCVENSREIKRGEEAIIISHNTDDDTYYIEPIN